MIQSGPHAFPGAAVAGAVAFRGTERFQLVRFVGRGGMGVVYEAIDRTSNMRVALKLLPLLRADLLFHFKNEFRALADIHHPNLVRLGELFSADEQWFFSMQFVAGVGFLEYVRRSPGERRVPALSPLPVMLGDPLGGTDLTIRLPRGPEASAEGPRPADEARLRAGLSQLAQGLVALHGAGKVHRDIKPSNVLVTDEDRVVILDFGLVGDAIADHQTLVGLGTPLYMAPEQATRDRVGPAADWYSVGVILYEALTGRAPFEGLPHEVLYHKQTSDPPSPRALAPGTPADLEELCMALLRRRPEERPSGADVLARLGGAPAVRGPAPSGEFFGRQAELEALRAAFADARAGRPVVALVRGESGVGKTALVRRFVEELTQAGEATVLAGRCYERESVPYKAFDGVIDALTHHLLRRSATEVERLLPRRAALLMRVFPVLGRLEPVAAADPGAPVLDPRELRARVFDTVRELLGRLVTQRPLVLLIDDLHWADADSLLLLEQVLRGPDAPPVLLVCTLREAPPGLSALEGAGLDLRTVALANLAPAAASALASTLLGTGAGGDGQLIAAEAGGHPLFIQELVWHTRTHGPRRTALRLDEVLSARVGALDGQGRLLLELLATAGGPVSQEALSDAAAMDREEFATRLADLRAGNLVRTRGPRWADAVELFHDRVRQTVLSGLASGARREHQARLARALEGRADPATLALHWREAGHPEKAAPHAALAGDQASAALAFERAVQHYRMALELGRWSEEEARDLRVRLAEALAKAGQGAAAGRLFLEAAAGANPARALEHQRRGAEELLRSGHVDEGLQAVHTAMAAAGMTLARSPRTALLALVAERARLRLRGLRFRERDEAQVPAADLARIDLCWSLSSGLGLTDHIRGAQYQARSLRLALAAGEPYRIARGLAGEGGFSATRGAPGARRTAKLLDRARALAERLGHPHALGHVALMTGIAAHLQGEFARARHSLEDAERLFRERCTGVAWELDATRQFWMECLFYLGDLPSLTRCVDDGLRDARERGDLYAATNLRTGLACFAWLAADDPERAAHENEEAMAGWSHRGFHVQHWYALCAEANIELYRGRAAEALARLRQTWAPLARSMLLGLQHTRIVALHLRARAALAAASGSEAPDLLALAAADARRLRRERVGWAVALADAVAGGIAAQTGDRAGAATLIARAAERFDALSMPLHAACARHVVGGPPAAAWFAAARVKAPERLARALVPGFGGEAARG